MYLTNLSKLNNQLDAFDGIFDSFFNFPNTRPSTWTTINSFGTDYRVNDNSLELSLPGFTKKEIDIAVDNGILTISSDVKEEGFRQSFNKSFRLPATIDTDSISASMKDGILTIDFKRTDNVKKINIK
tara:strand:+ start:12071 stop:12454 length:384 start_codon:yes stop_codon:yes gene_type:complete